MIEFLVNNAHDTMFLKYVDVDVIKDTNLYIKLLHMGLWAKASGVIDRL